MNHRTKPKIIKQTSIEGNLSFILKEEVNQVKYSRYSWLHARQDFLSEVNFIIVHSNIWFYFVAIKSYHLGKLPTFEFERFMEKFPSYQFKPR